MPLYNINIDSTTTWIFIYIILFLRYVIIAGTGYLIFWKTDRWQHLRIQEAFPERSSLLREFIYSMITFIIFTVTGVLIFAAKQNGYTLLYDEIDEYGWIYFIASILISILVHDTYFYWAHRFMHLQKVFRYFHRVHHLSVNPSPWAAFSFHPLESILEALILPILVFTLPLHIYSIAIFLTFMTVMNVEGHLGYELFPSGFTRNKLFKWSNTSTHHNMHHRFFSCNYGLYFNWWDRIMNTNHENYHDFFEKIKLQKKKSAIHD